MKFKRLAAYVVDIMLVSFLSSLIFTTVFKDNATKYEESMLELRETMQTLGSGIENNDTINDLTYTMAKNSVTLTIITVSLQIIYFIFIQYFLNGVTAGKKLLGIHVKSVNSKKLSAPWFVLREVILFVMPVKIIDIILLINLKKDTYMSCSSVGTYITMIVYILIIGFMIFRDDNKGLHDILCKSDVVEVKKKKKLEE